jgi:Urease accessory protein UreE
MLLIRHFAALADESVDEELSMPFDQRQRRRLRTRLASGEEVAFLLPDGTVLRDGDRLDAEDGRILRIAAETEPLMEARPADARAWCRAAYHLGNRHVALQIGDGWLRFQRDAVLAQMLDQLGIPVVDIQAAFDPEPGAYGGGHHHHDGAERGHRGVIHEFQP